MSQRFIMRRKILALGDDSWIKDQDGRDVFYVDNKAFALRKTYSIIDENHHEVLKIQHKPLNIRRTIDIEQAGRVVARVQKNLISPLVDRWTIEMPGGENLTAQGDLLDHEYAIHGRNNETLAHISKQWFTIRESYGIEIADGVDVPLMIGIAIAIDDMMDSIGTK